MKIFAFLWIPLLIVLHVHASVTVPSDKPYEKKDTEDIEVIFPEEHRDLADYVVAKESVIRSLYQKYFGLSLDLFFLNKLPIPFTVEYLYNDNDTIE